MPTDPLANRPLEAEVDFSAKVRPKSRPRPTDLVIQRFAESQHGIVTVAHLRDLGLSERASSHRAATGRLHRLHRGVLAVERPRQEGRWLAAVLACGDGAVLSHASAAALWGLIPDPAGVVHVNVAHTQRRGRSGIVAHRATLAPEDVTSREGIPCTTLARALVDVAATISPQRLERALVVAEERGQFDLTALRDQIARMRGQRGCAALAAALSGFDDRAVTRSVAEARFLALVKRRRLPKPEVNAWLPLPEGGGYRPDFLWRDRRLIVEVDGRTHHSLRRAFEHDRQRDRRLLQAGYSTVRFPARQVLDEPARVAQELQGLLSLARPRR
jgi:very-short-patch-repair endonuclease/predicted transcriptional regulator of viral defense system